MLIHVSEREFFSPSCGNFAAECDWNSEISHKVQNLDFSEKKIVGFFKIAKAGKFAVGFVSNGMTP